MIKNAMTIFLFILAIPLLFLCPSLAFAEVKEIIAEGTYNMGDGETPTVAESRARLNAERNAIEQAGIYIESYSKVKNFQLTHDEIQVLASGVMEVTILEKKRTLVGDGFNFWVKIKARVSTDKIEEMARRVKDKSEVEDYRRLQESYEKLAKDFELLKKELKESKSEKESKQIEAKITNEERLFQARTWYEKGKIQGINRKYDDAIESFNSAIALDSNYVDAYNGRGAAYWGGKQYYKALEDFDKAISLDSMLAKSYSNRGLVYLTIRQLEKSLEDFNKAISIDPHLAEPYMGRGFLYIGKREYDRAFEDLNKAITLDSNLARAYGMRGIAYYLIDQPGKSLEDINKAISLDPNMPEAWLAEAYYYRALVYGILGNPSQALIDMNAAARMENKKAQQWLLQMQKGEKWKYPSSAIEEKGLEREPKPTPVSGMGKSFKDPLTGIEFVFIKGGCFAMGDTFGDGANQEKPAHEVCVDDFYLAKYEVTQAQWEKVMGNNPSDFKGVNNPVERVSWGDAQQFIERLNSQTGKKYRLPTEAEWEYAARSGGKKEKYAGTSQEGELAQYAWNINNSGGKTHPVGQKNPDGLGLYDMSGNVLEWCADWYDQYYYRNSPKDNPRGPGNGRNRVIRGGCWGDVVWCVRAAYRFSLDPVARTYGIGFRLGASAR